jgi:hypothetical protein
MAKKQFDLPDELDAGENIPGLDDSFADIVEGTSSRTTLLQRRADGNLVMHNVVLTPVGFQPANDDLPALHNINQDMWQQIGSTLFEIETSLQWAVGDWLAAGERARYGTVKALAEAMGRRPDLFHQWTFVSRKIRFLWRHKNLTWSHHEVVAKMCAEDEITEWLQYAEDENLSTKALRKAIKESKQTDVTVTNFNPKLAANHTWIGVEKLLNEQSDLHKQLEYLDQLHEMIERRRSLLRQTEQDNQLNSGQKHLLLTLYQKGPQTYRYNGTALKIARTLVEMNFVEIRHEGTRYTVFILRPAEEHLRQIGEIA